MKQEARPERSGGEPRAPDLKPASARPALLRAELALQRGFVVAALVHVALIPGFWILGVRPLAAFNVLSVAAFAFGLNELRRGHPWRAMTLVMCEVLIHQSLCVHYLGWEAGFQYYLLVLPLPFLLPAPRLGVSVGAAAFSFGTFAGLAWFYGSATPVVAVAAPLLEALNFANLVLAFALTGLFTYYFARGAERAETALADAHRRTEALLHNTLPRQVADQLERDGRVDAVRYPEATILFADLVGFTPLATSTPPAELVMVLHTIFSSFDDLVDRLGLEKIKTIGDAYMVASGVPEPREDHAEAMAELALQMRETLSKSPDARAAELTMRIGVHIGPVVAGVIGKRKFAYDLWGDTVNTAARMESHGVPGEIQVSEALYRVLKDRFDLVERGLVEVKGKGPMRTWFLRGRRARGA